MNTFYAIFGILIPFLLTTIGSAFVYCLKSDFNKKISALIMGFSAGIMVAASIWSMIIPSFNYMGHWGNWSFIPAAVGISLGCIFVLLADIIINKVNKPQLKNEILNDKKLSRFLIAFTVHNIPEGLAVGFALGSAILLNSATALTGAMGLAIGIAIQNLPEGMAVSLPVYKATGKKTKSFFVGLFSGIVELAFAILGFLLAMHIEFLIPWLLCFSAGCMLFVTAEDLIPESKVENSHIGTWGFIIGFLIMMILDITLG